MNQTILEVETLKNQISGGYKMFNTELAWIIVSELKRRGYETDYEKVLGKIDLTRSPKEEKQDVDVEGYIKMFESELEWK
jgi:hypothetical protein